MNIQDTRAATAMRLSGFDGRVAAVTGAASGIGLRVAETFEALGATVAGIDVAAEGSDRFAVAVDVRDESAVGRGFDAIERELGPVDLLVTCAGVFVPTPI